MQINFTQTFCKPHCDWLINRGWWKFTTLQSLGISSPLGVVNSLATELGYHQAEQSCFLEWFFITLVLQRVMKVKLPGTAGGVEILCETDYWEMVVGMYLCLCYVLSLFLSLHDTSEKHNASEVIHAIFVVGLLSGKLIQGVNFYNCT